MKTKQLTKKLFALCCGLFATWVTLYAQTQTLYQNNDVSLITNGGGGAAPGGNLWGQVFGDYAYMAHGDSLGRGTKEQYKGLGAANQTQHPNAFEIRRAYLGYDYKINSKFSATALLAYEGDEDVNDNRTVYLKYIYGKWKNIWKNTDLKIGQQATNAFSNAYNTVSLMGYRSVERTIMDMHGIDASADMGVTLEGRIWTTHPADTSNIPTFIGYCAMVGDNSGNNPVAGFTGTAASISTSSPAVSLNPLNSTTDKAKRFRGNLYVNTLNNKLTIGAYTDYLNYGNVPYSKSSTIRWQALQTVKGYAAYNSKWFGLGGEWFMQSMTNGETEVWKKGTGINDTATAIQSGYSLFAHGTLIQNKLNVFARYDIYTPDTKYSYNPNETFTTRFTNISSITYGNIIIAGNTYKETFINAGLDWSPTKDKKVHVMPNIWYYGIKNGFGSGNMANDYYLLYRVTFLFVFN